MKLELLLIDFGERNIITEMSEAANDFKVIQKEGYQILEELLKKPHTKNVVRVLQKTLVVRQKSFDKLVAPIVNNNGEYDEDEMENYETEVDNLILTSDVPYFREMNRVLNVEKNIVGVEKKILNKTITVMSDNGKKWIKIFAMSQKRLSFDKDRHAAILCEVKELVDLSRQEKYKITYNFPLVSCHFRGTPPPELLAAIHSLGANKVDDELKETCKENDEFLLTNKLETKDDDNTDETKQKLDYKDETKNHETVDQVGVYSPLNLDVTALVAIASKDSAKTDLVNHFQKLDGKLPRIIVCQTALNIFQEILATIGGPQEKERSKKALLELNVEIVADNPSQRVSEMKISRVVTKESITIFGTGDSYNAVNVTTKKIIVSRLKNVGIFLPFYFHEVAKLSEVAKMVKPVPHRKIIEAIDEKNLLKI